MAEKKRILSTDWIVIASATTVIAFVVGIQKWYVDTTVLNATRAIEDRINKGWFTERMFDNRMSLRDAAMDNLSRKVDRLRDQDIPSLKEVTGRNAEAIAILSNHVSQILYRNQTRNSHQSALYGSSQ